MGSSWASITLVLCTFLICTLKIETLQKYGSIKSLHLREVEKFLGLQKVNANEAMETDQAN